MTREEWEAEDRKGLREIEEGERLIRQGQERRSRAKTELMKNPSA